MFLKILICQIQNQNRLIVEGKYQILLLEKMDRKNRKIKMRKMNSYMKKAPKTQ